MFCAAARHRLDGQRPLIYHTTNFLVAVHSLTAISLPTCQRDKILNTEAFVRSYTVSIAPQDRKMVVTLREETVKKRLGIDTSNVPTFFTTLKAKHTLF